MTREDILKLAREAGVYTHKEVQPEIARFAALVAAHERELCAKVCESLKSPLENADRLYNNGTAACAAAIRARSQA
jgi:hypothetical protein